VGPLIGRRTWGGVVGIWPRHGLIDGGKTTQPEFASWFVDVGWSVENYGTDPDIDIDIAPHEYRQGKDPQLDCSIVEVLKLLETQPPFRPNLDEE
jgi:tricorn protease